MWKVCAEKAKTFGVEIKMHSSVKELHYNENKWTAVLMNGEKISDFDLSSFKVNFY